MSVFCMTEQHVLLPLKGGLLIEHFLTRAPEYINKTFEILDLLVVRLTIFGSPFTERTA
jgi:hypothetical protein